MPNDTLSQSTEEPNTPITSAIDSCDDTPPHPDNSLYMTHQLSTNSSPNRIFSDKMEAEDWQGKRTEGTNTHMPMEEEVNESQIEQKMEKASSPMNGILIPS